MSATFGRTEHRPQHLRLHYRQQRRQAALEYKEYMDQLVQLVNQVHPSARSSGGDYPSSIDSPSKRAIYDNFGKDEELATKIDDTVRNTKKADWVGHHMKEREVAIAIRETVASCDINVQDVMKLLKEQDEYR
ncbi:MAG: hypothetical protein ACPG8W_01725 [Candidatus Promineifilaceae bacterium]